MYSVFNTNDVSASPLAEEPQQTNTINITKPESPKVIAIKKDSNNNHNNNNNTNNLLSSSPSLYSYMQSPKEALQRLLFGYHSKTKRSLSEEAECGNEESVNSWVKDGVDPNGFDEYGYTPLLNAAVLGRLNAVIELINCNADVNKKGAFGFAPLHAAAQNGRREVVFYLLEHSADINAQNDDKDTPMHLALRANHIEIVNLLLRHGGDPLIKGFNDKNCIECAQEMGLPDLAQTFENYKSNSSSHQQQHQ